MPNSLEPTILVKKADGTSVRMTMEEFKKYKSTLKQPIHGDVSALGTDKNDNSKLETTTATVGSRLTAVRNYDRQTINKSMEGLKKLEEGETVTVDAPNTPKDNNWKLETTTPTIVGGSRLTAVRNSDRQTVGLATKEISHAQNQKAASPPANLLVGNDGLKDEISKPSGGPKLIVHSDFEKKKKITSPAPEKVIQLVREEDFASAIAPPQAHEIKAPDATLGTSDALAKADEIMKKITIPLRHDLRGRLQSLLQSRLKNVRDDEQTMEYFLKSEANGGIGLTSDDARYVLSLVHSILPQSRAAKMAENAGKTGRGNPNVKAQMTNSVSSEQKNNIKGPNYNEAKSQAPSTKFQTNSNIEIQNATVPASAAPVFLAPAAKVAMQDVVAPIAKPKESVGPLEEMRAFTFQNFRSFGKTPGECASRLLAKFEAWKGESYVFFLSARRAWRQSPLFLVYQDAIVGAIRDGKTIAAALAGGEMTGEEFEEIVKMNGKLM